MLKGILAALGLVASLYGSYTIWKKARRERKRREEEDKIEKEMGAL